MLGEIVDAVPNFGPPPASMAQHRNLTRVLRLAGEVVDERYDEEEGTVCEDTTPRQELPELPHRHLQQRIRTLHIDN